MIDTALSEAVVPANFSMPVTIERTPSQMRMDKRPSAGPKVHSLRQDVDEDEAESFFFIIIFKGKYGACTDELPNEALGISLSNDNIQ